MMRNAFFAALAILFLSSAAYCATEWQNVTSGIDEDEINGVSVAWDNPRIAYAAADGGVYKTKDGGMAWARSLDTGRGKVNFVIINPKDSKIVYAATDRGLYKTTTSGMDWERVFNGIDAKKIVKTIALNPTNPDEIYIGTDSGLFKSENSAGSWQRSAGLPKGSHIYHIAVNPADPQAVYAASDKGLFKTGDGTSSWEKAFYYIGLNEDTDETGDEAAEEPEEALPAVRAVVIDPGAPDKVYLATDEGIFESVDSGSSWHNFIDDGLLSKDINFLAFSPFEPNDLYAATGKGVFQFLKDKNIWEDLRLNEGEANFVTCDIDENNSLWVTTEEGVYKTAEELNEAESMKMETDKFFTYFNNEPSVREVQEAAIKYAEVGPEKIAQWRRAAKSKALLPSLSFGINKANSDTYEIYTSSSTQYYIAGPEDETRGWDIDLTWNLGELIWNEDQTQIDVRSKLMVQLRDDILDEVTRYYFERRKLQIELLEAPPEDTQSSIRKELRLQELTANIDALTGGYLSDHLQ